MDDPIALADARYTERRIEVEPGVSLLLRAWDPLDPSVDWPVVFVPGWISLPQGWAHMLQALAARQPVRYLELREKHTACFSRPMSAADFTIARNAEDLRASAPRLGVAPERAVWVAASLGATVLLAALAEGLPARAAFLLGPNAHFHFPWWAVPLTYGPSWLYPPIRDFLIWYLGRFKVDAEREPEQLARYHRTLHAAEPTRLKYSARSFAGFEVWPSLPRITTPVGVAWASSDTLHGEEDVRRLAAELPQAVPVPCPSNLYLHRADIVPDLDRFLAELTG
ncbi:MAG: alpha/beta hydrolase [Pseudomonadota bacterium]